ncbi:MAG: hypothetical protein JWO03_3653 [Bacteroidetes bacterium]|nr:hypothetical protein [Bacteroidota bacterium]
MNTPVYRRLLLALKVGIFIFMSLVIYRRVSSVQHFVGSFDVFMGRFSGGNVALLLTVILLMPLNWALEAIKWKLLLKHSAHVTLREALRSVLGGLSIGFATPARVGEFAGRVMFLHKGERVDGIYLSALGGIAQSIVTFLTALFMLRFYTGKADVFFSAYSYVGFALLAFIMIGLYISFDQIVEWLHHRGLSIDNYIIPTGKTPHRNDKWLVFITSFFRYSVYVLQYYLLLRFVGIEGNLFEMTAAISLVLFLQSVSPLIPLTDMTVRGGIALLVFADYGNHMTIGIFMVPVMLWAINLLIPAIVGYFYILNLHADEPAQ